MMKINKSYSFNKNYMDNKKYFLKLYIKDFFFFEKKKELIL